jgi:hypothetical protein
MKLKLARKCKACNKIIFLSFSILAACHLDLLQAILFIAILSAPAFLAA